MKLHTKLLLAAALPTLLLAACGGGDDSIDDRLNLADPKVRLVHAVPAAPNVSLFRDDQPQGPEVTNLAYKGASVYFDTATGTHKWDVRTVGTPSATVGSVTFDLSRGSKYTLVAVPDAGSLTEAVLIADPYNKSVASDNARVRAFNASFNTTAYDVYLTAAGVDINTVTATLPAVNYKAAVPASGSDSVMLEGGDYVLRLTTAGTKSVIFTSPVTLAKNADWLLATVPNGLTANDVHVLVVQSDANAPATELVNQP